MLGSLGLILLCTAALVYAHVMKLSSYNEVLADIAYIESTAKREAQDYKMRRSFQKTYASADPSFLKTHLESLVFLKKEVSLLNKVRAQPSFSRFKPIIKRVNFLTKGENSLNFTQESKSERDQIKEEVLKLKHPVSVDIQDVKKILTAIEGVWIPPNLRIPYSPWFCFKTFSLTKQHLTESREAYQLEMEVISRQCV